MQAPDLAIRQDNEVVPIGGVLQCNGQLRAQKNVEIGDTRGARTVLG